VLHFARLPIVYFYYKILIVACDSLAVDGVARVKKGEEGHAEDGGEREDAVVKSEFDLVGRDPQQKDAGDARRQHRRPPHSGEFLRREGIRRAGGAMPITPSPCIVF